jgi:putative alpha-1,2-mannosidase
MEYSANDHAISLVARGLGHIHDAERYLKRSRNWRNLYDKDYVHRMFNFKEVLLKAH